MSRNGKVVVAMSGGVDSSVAACLLKEQGYECIGAFMRVGAAVSEDEVCSIEAASGDAHQHAGSSTSQSESGTAAQPRRNLRHGCCSATDALDARVIAGKLDIPFYSLNFQRDFDRIIDYFVDEYAAARTPNPCIQCNVHLKFGKLLRYADLMDAEFIATGHYARTLRADAAAQGRSQSGDVRLARAVNRAKDQSYVLFGIQREDLWRCLFPIGAIADKAEVRRIAERLGLRVHDKPDSQEICFVPDDDYRTLVRSRRPGSLQPGEFRDPEGRILGRHEGVPGYTIGQRRGLGLALGSPVYVTALNVLDNIVTVGAKEDLLADGLIADRLNWHADPPPAGQWLPAEIKIRHQHTPAAGRFRTLASGEVEARFDQPQIAVTPGQAAVFYDGEFVLGGGWICRSIRASERTQ